MKGFDEFIAYSESMSPLGNADGEACADYCISLFSDLTRFVTMQNLFHDGFPTPESAKRSSANSPTPEFIEVLCNLKASGA